MKTAALMCAVVASLAFIAGCSSGQSGSKSVTSTPSASASAEKPFTRDEQAYLDMVTEDAAKVAGDVQTISRLAATIPWGYDASMKIGSAVGELKAMRDTYKWLDLQSTRLAPFRKEWNAALGAYVKASERLEYANDHGDAGAFAQAKRLWHQAMGHGRRASEEMGKILSAAS